MGGKLSTLGLKRFNVKRNGRTPLSSTGVTTSFHLVPIKRQKIVKCYSSLKKEEGRKGKREG
jgi:hypothetical protein